MLDQKVILQLKKKVLSFLNNSDRVLRHNAGIRFECNLEQGLVIILCIFEFSQVLFAKSGYALAVEVFLLIKKLVHLLPYLLGSSRQVKLYTNFLCTKQLQMRNKFSNFLCFAGQQVLRDRSFKSFINLMYFTFAFLIANE